MIGPLITVHAQRGKVFYLEDMERSAVVLCKRRLVVQTVHKGHTYAEGIVFGI